MDATGHFARPGSGPRDGARRSLLPWVVGAVALLVVTGSLHLILTVTGNQEELARHGRWLQQAGELQTLLEDVADEADASANGDPAAFHAQIPQRLKQELATGALLAACPLAAEGRADEWQRSTLPLQTAVRWLLEDENVQPRIVTEPALEMADAVGRTLPKAAAALTERSEQLHGEQAWLLAVGALVALGSALLAVLYVRLRRNRDALAEFSEALRENEERYRQMFEQNNGIKLLIASGSGHIVEANRAACTFYGGSTQTLRALRMQNIIESTRKTLEEMIATAADPTHVTLHMRHRLLDGDVRDVEMHISPVLVHGNRMLYAIVHDVTEKLAMEKEMRRAEHLESLGVLAGGIAHDFNNFLASMIGNLQLAQLDVAPETPVAEALTAADGACRRAQNLARQLLTFTKGGTPVRQPMSLGDLVRQTTEFALRGSAADFEIDIAPDLAIASVDEGQISQVIQNLVINASQAMPKGGTVRVVARNRDVARGDGLALESGRYVHLSVHDDGIGIPPEDVDRIFQPYFTTKKGGSGLGLATSYSIVRKHEGVLTVDSVVGVGTSFHVHLPVSDDVPAPAPTRPSSTTTGGERILWLDDDEAITAVVERMLVRYGYRVVACRDGAEVVERYADALKNGDPFDLVVMDLTVPGGMGGKEALARLRETDPDVRAVACSGYHDDEVLQDHAAHGFCGALAKPFTRDALASLLIDTLGDADRAASEAA